MKHAVWILVIVLVVLHQDYWQWSDGTLDFGFLPRALTYHISLSVVAAVVWWLAVRHAWPAGLDGTGRQGESAGQGGDAGS